MRKFAIILSILFLVGFDLISKAYIESILPMSEYIPLFSEYLWFKISYNTGIAFSLPIEGLLLKSITLILLVGIIGLYIKEEYPKNSRFMDMGYTLILSGAISHAYERIYIWHVVDFIAVKYFAILNFADIFISVGAFFLVIAYGFHARSRS